MELLAPEHVGAVVLTAVACAGAALAGRGDPARAVALSRALAVLILVAYGVEHATFVLRGTWTLERNLPFHLTDAVTLVSAAALWTGRRALVEATWFWALTASLQAVLTPDLGAGPDEVFFWTFFVTHSGAVAAAVLLVVGRGLTPRPGSVRRVFALTAAVAAAAALANLLTGGNYMFLREKPGDPSLLDVMGPWPWYVVSAAGLALALFVALDAPFRRGTSSAGGV